MFDPLRIKNFPAESGVYLMKNQQGTVLYVGKAKNIKQRVKQYFAVGGDGREMVPFLIAQIHSIDTVIVTSEKEALILENNLIKKYRPKYNALFKDDKSYIALKVTRHQWPRIDIVRYRGKPKSDGYYFGPYTNAFSARKTLDLLQKIFPMRQCSDKEFSRRTRPCILFDMKRCIAPCVGKCTHEEYD
jgi:excinuclease ABC subunit C